jgi:hypothetical protein
MRAAAGRAEPAPGAIAQMQRRVGIAKTTLSVDRPRMAKTG